MSTTADQLQLLVDGYALADDSNDIEGRVRAAAALKAYVAKLHDTDNSRAWIASDRTTREQTAAHLSAHPPITGREIGKPDRRADRSPTLGRRVSDKVAARLKERT